MWLLKYREVIEGSNQEYQCIIVYIKLFRLNTINVKQSSWITLMRYTTDKLASRYTSPRCQLQPLCNAGCGRYDYTYIHIHISVCIANVDRFCAFLLCYLDGARPQLLAGSVRYDFKLSSHARDDSLQPAHSKGYRASARKLSSRAR
jgi:hypothetical protein